MSEHDSCQFRNKSISQLVKQLNNLGDDHVAMQQTTLIGIQQADNSVIRRFRSKSVHKYTSNQHLQNSREMINQKKLQFFLTDNSQKKYYYHEITNELQTVTVGSIMSKFQQGFNTTLILQFKQSRYWELISKIQPWFNSESQNNGGQCLAHFLEFQSKDAIDILDNRKSISLEQSLDKNHPFYDVKINDLKKLKNLDSKCIKILKLQKKNGNCSELRIIFFPERFLTQNVDDPTLKIVKNQLNQIFSYIKTNPNKRYQKINSLIPKRFPTAVAIAQLLLYDSANFVINWILDNKQEKSIINGRFDFFQKLYNISNFIKKVNQNDISLSKNRKIIRKNSLKKLAPKSPYKNISSETNLKHLNTIETQFKNQEIDNKTVTIQFKKEPKKFQEISGGNTRSNYPKSMKQLEYCRSFERKTHKYSVSQFQQSSDFQNSSKLLKNQNDVQLFPNRNQQNQGNNNKINIIKPQCTQSEGILILKAQHARQISQYHETVQNLNKKILILTSEKGLSELYTIHEREIMHLELKIEQLRKDISKICNNSEKGDKNRELKSMIKKLNDEISLLQKSSPSYKVSQGKIKMLEKQLVETRKKFQSSEIARKQLSFQIQSLTKQIQLKDKLSPISNNNQHTPGEYLYELSPKQQETFKELESLMAKQMKSKEAESHVLRKIKNALADLSQIRQTVLDCNAFLVSLQEHLEGKLSDKDPEVVLDCNRFIRNYLLQNLDIF